MAPLAKWRSTLIACVGAGVIAYWSQHGVPDRGEPIPKTPDRPLEVPLAKRVDADNEEPLREDADFTYSGAHSGDVVAAFEKLNRYQQGTTPVSDDDYDLLNPGARYERRHSLSRNPGDPDADWSVLLTADRYYITEDQTSLVTLSLWHGDAPKTATIESARISMFDNIGKPISRPATVFYAGNQAVIRLKPSDYWPAESGPLKVEITYSSHNLGTKRGRLDFHYTGPERIPAAFIDVLADNVIEGDLVFDVAVEVYQKGEYRISALIHDKEGAAFGRAQVNSWLEPGSHLVPLTFDGLLFHDKAVSAPFHLSTLRGERRNPASLQGNDQMPVIAGRYETPIYEASVFNQDFIASPRYERMKQHYENAISRGVTFLPVDD